MRNSLRQTALELPAGTAEPERALLRLGLTSGDERLTLRPDTGCNRYGVPPHTPRTGAWFASSTASPITARGTEAARVAIRAALDGGVREWPDAIRATLQELFGIPGSQVVLAGSGTEAELIVVALARNLLRRPLTNIVVAPTETGSGVMAAAGGRHFLDTASCQPQVRRGELLDGLAAGEITVEGVPLRDATGHERTRERVDVDVLMRTHVALAEGRDVLVHCLDASKTGLSGLQRSTARAIVDACGPRALVVVDACQLRCSPEAIRADLASGFTVMLTGSKFIGGPPFCGAVLVPPALADRLDDLALPAGLAAYSTRSDWPQPCHAGITGAFKTEVNLALCTRWSAALAEATRYFAIAPARRAAIAEAFARLVRSEVTRVPGLTLLPSPQDGTPTIFPILSDRRDGRLLEAPALQETLASRGFRLGQPVGVGHRMALRVCLAAPQVSDVAERLATGASLDQAMALLGSDLHALFATWSQVLDEPLGEAARAA